MLTDLRLQHFRSYTDSSFELNSGVNIIVGPNASGKTNLLEAILVLAKGSSYRARDTELISFNQPWARIDSHDDTGAQRTVKIITEPTPGKQYEIGGKQFKRLTSQHMVPVVLFEPNHLQLFAGGSERRRDYLDDLLEQVNPSYGTARRQYRRTLTQRNTLLKQGFNVIESQIFPWNVRLSQLAGVIVRARSEMAERINDRLGALYRELSKTKTDVAVAYNNHWPVDNYESRFLKDLEISLGDDVRRGFTGSGPHREDLSVSFNSRPTQEVASRGEIRTAVLALKIIELKIIEDIREKTPLLLLDDVFSELDGKRRHALTDYLTYYQTFITTTDADLVIKNFTQRQNILALSNK